MHATRLTAPSPFARSPFARSPYALSLLALLCSPAAFARPISLADAVGAAIGHNPDLASAAEGVASAEAGVRAAEAVYVPVLSASSELSGSQNEGFLAGYPYTSQRSGLSSGLGLDETLPTGTTLGLQASLDQDRTNTTTSLGGVATEQEQASWSAGIDLTLRQDLLAPFVATDDRVSHRKATEAHTQARLSATATAEATVSAVADAWWNLWAAGEEVRVAKGALEAASALETRIVARKEVGVAMQLEVDQVAAERLAAQRGLLMAEASQRAASNQLLLALGEAPGEVVEPVGDERLWQPSLSSEEAALAVALAGDPQLALAAAKLEAAEAALRDSRAVGLPDLALSGSLGVGSLEDSPSAALSALSTEGGLPRYSVGLNLSVPLGGRAGRAAEDAATAAVNQARLEVETRTREVQVEFYTALDAARTAEQGVALAEARLKVAEAAEAGERARLEQGTRRTDEVLDAMADRVGAERDLVSARIDRASAERDLAGLLGGLAREVRF